jgi:hypothetical protein
MRGYVTIDPVAARGSYSISMRRGSAVSSASGPGVQETGCATQATYANLPAAVPSDERAPLFAALSARKQKLELAEESLILLAETQRVPIARRADADARIVLTTLLAP